MSGFRLKATVAVHGLDDRHYWWGKLRRETVVLGTHGDRLRTKGKMGVGWVNQPDNAKLYFSAKNALRSIASGAAANGTSRAWPGPALETTFAIEHVHRDGTVEEVPWPE